ncbi:thymidine kinase [Pelagicoccus albus]|uniref:Thymidine kinase n=1 Tax=Pelagicoccus albus TaxID=415222 RepID=A0A7X1B6L4_9BACT|nr:thymidine kinase [Pelagicoccus albus]MBC2606595.1 thymidine kinase [Pelagicoccus albus]
MSKLYFYYSSMNAGKSTNLLQSSFNYRERGLNTILYTPEVDDRHERGKIRSRIGLESDANLFNESTNLFEEVKLSLEKQACHCVMVDEAQFLTKQHVFQLGEVADRLDVPVLAFGLRTDFQGEPFEGSKYLMAWADDFREIKAICYCGRKATMVVRMNEAGQVVTEGAQIEIGGNDKYVSFCRKHFKERFYGENR